MEKISAVIITFNEEKNIARCLQSLQGVVDEIVVVDSLSTDRTEEICRQFGVKFLQQAWLGFGKQKNFAISNTSYNWILNIDADESLTPKLANEIKSIFAQSSVPYAAYYVPITLNFLGRKFKHGTENKQLHLRIVDKTLGRFTDADVHEKMQVTGSVGRLKNEVLHYSFHNIEHFLHKFNSYTSVAAQASLKKGKKARKGLVGIDLFARFVIAYFIRRNFLNGYEGFVWSVFNAYYKFVRSCKQIELSSIN